MEKKGLELLSMIYREGGPVNSVYRRYGLRYRAKGFWSRFWNRLRLGRISLHHYEDLRAKVKRGLAMRLDSSLGFAARREIFMNEYAVIFEVNLLANLAVARLAKLLRREKVAVAEILAGSFETEFEGVLHFEGAGLKGNGLDLDDFSDFVMREMRHELTEGVKEWYLGLSEKERHNLIP